MAGITLEIATAKLQQYLDAEEKILRGQEVIMDGDKLSLADLAAVQQGIKIWDARCQQLDPAGGRPIRVREVIPR